MQLMLMHLVNVLLSVNLGNLLINDKSHAYKTYIYIHKIAKFSLLWEGCENWFPKGSLRMLQNGLLARTFGPQGKGVTGLREARSEALHSLFSGAYNDQRKEHKTVVGCNTCREMRKDKPTGKPRNRWNNNVT
jgi:hypothetical protein